MRPSAERTDELGSKACSRLARRLDATKPHRVGRTRDGCIVTRESEAKAGSGRRSRDTCVGPAVRIGDRCQSPAYHLFERGTPLDHDRSQRTIVEAWKAIVVQRVKANVEPSRDKHLHLVTAQARILRVWAELMAEALGQCGALGGTHGLDCDCELVDTAAFYRQVETVVEGSLESLPPEREGMIERGAAKEKRRRHPEPRQARSGKRDVRCQVVVERERDREPSSAPSGLDRAQELIQPYHPITPPQMPKLGLERVDGVCWDELVRGVARLCREPVINEYDACASPGQAECRAERGDGCAPRTCASGADQDVPMRARGARSVTLVRLRRTCGPSVSPVHLPQ